MMLTLDDVTVIKNHDASNRALNKALTPGDWSYIRDSESEETSELHIVTYPVGGKHWSVVNIDIDPSSVAPVLLLKLVPKEQIAKENI